MKRLIILLFISGSIGCSSPSPEKSSGYLYVKTIDGCEYVIYNEINEGGITHHGNCHNPKHEKQLNP